MNKKKGLTKDEIKRLKDYAKLLYVDQGVTNQKELADRVGVSVQSINKWINENDEEWKRLRQSFLITKESELRRFYMQMQELNDVIMNRPVGERFGTTKEADIQIKITAAIRNLETDTSTSEAMTVLKEFLTLIRADNLEFAKEVAKYADLFIKDLTNKGR